MEKGSYKVLCFLWKVQRFQALWRFLFPWRNLNSYILIEAFQPSGKNCLWMWLKIQGTNTRHVCQKPALTHIYVWQWDRGYLLLSQVHVHKGKPSSAFLWMSHQCFMASESLLVHCVLCYFPFIHCGGHWLTSGHSALCNESVHVCIRAIKRTTIVCLLLCFPVQ